MTSDLNFGRPKVAILLGTFNGERFLAEQLQSLEDQTYSNWFLIVSDDGSNDKTLEILKKFQTKWSPGKLILRNGQQKGFCHNFLSMACDEGVIADYYAFCDQDDVWLPGKLVAAVEFLSALFNRDMPHLYCGRTIYVSAEMKPMGASILCPFPPSFRNALVQSIAGGNTMVFNQATKNLLNQTGIVNVVSHDWWIYLLVQSVGGRVHYDSHPHVLYRQHPDALIGGNVSMIARFERVFLLLMGRFKRWNDMHIAALIQIKDIMDPSAVDVLHEFMRMRDSKLKHRFRMIEVCGLYRQSLKGTLGLMIAALINRI